MREFGAALFGGLIGKELLLEVPKHHGLPPRGRGCVSHITHEKKHTRSDASKFFCAECREKYW